jgi:hypothetical protein
LGEADALAVAFGEFAKELLFDVLDGAALANVIGALAQLDSRKALQFADKGQVFGGPHLGIERRHFGKVTGALLDFERLFQHVEPGDSSFSRGWREKAGKHAHGGGFAGAVGAEEAHNLALLDLKRDVVHSRGARVPLRKLLDGYHSFLSKETKMQCI